MLTTQISQNDNRINAKHARKKKVYNTAPYIMINRDIQALIWHMLPISIIICIVL